MPRTANKQPYRYTVLVGDRRYTYSALSTKHAQAMHDKRGLPFRYNFKRTGLSWYPLGTVIIERVVLTELEELL